MVKRLWLAVASTAVIVGVGVAAVLLNSHEPRTAESSAMPTAMFPQIDRTALSDRQIRVIDVLRTEFDAQPPGTTYSDGVEEPWCADFVSWVMHRANMPLVNPNSGSWRIPGVYTLQEAFQADGRFEPADYRPRPGDVVLYAQPSRLGLHTNIVVATDGTTLITVGGNEVGGIRVQRFETGPDAGLLGYGRLS